MKKVFKILAIFLIFFNLVGCGSKGPLYLPTSKLDTITPVINRFAKVSFIDKLQK